MAARCKHIRVRVEREYRAWQATDFDNLVPTDTQNIIQEWTGRIGVECDDCGYSRYYARRAYAPRWLQTLLDELDSKA